VIFRSPYSDIAIPDLPLHQLVLGNARRWAGTPALIDGPTGAATTYGELATAVERAAVGFAQRGLRKGDVVALVSPNVPLFAVAFFGAESVGGAVSLHNPLLTANELATQFEAVAARFVVTAPPLLPTVLEAAGRTQVEEVFVFGEAAGATPFTALLEADALPRVAIDSEDLALLLFSSGTTGLPKAVMLTHRNMATTLSIVQQTGQLGPDDSLIAVAPFFHSYGLMAVLLWGLAQGASIVTMPRFEFESMLQLIQEHRVTRAHLPPPIMNALAKHPAVDGYDLSSLRVLLTGGAPCAEEIVRRCAERLGCRVWQGYGLTEGQPTHITPRDGGKPGSVGVCLANTESKVIDIETGAELGPNQRGELWVRGPQVMRGYLNNPEATAATITIDGWLKTGDIGYADADGHFTIVDRLKELIKYKGYQVAPAELEALLLTHPAVADAAVIGIPDEEAGELPKAFVVARGDVSAEELLAFVAGQVAPYKKLRRLEFTDAIPKAPSGKLLRRVLRDRERGLVPA
jgi:acyl-CoA synthetase (AMP-forming)/AMP-acid ligase II